MPWKLRGNTATSRVHVRRRSQARDKMNRCTLETGKQIPPSCACGFVRAFSRAPWRRRGDSRASTHKLLPRSSSSSKSEQRKWHGAVSNTGNSDESNDSDNDDNDDCDSRGDVNACRTDYDWQSSTG